MTSYGWAWVAWAAVMLASFLGLEVWALATRGPMGTLSRWLRRWLGIQPHRPWATAGIAVFVGFLTWLGVHIVFGVLP